MIISTFLGLYKLQRGAQVAAWLNIINSAYVIWNYIRVCQAIHLAKMMAPSTDQFNAIIAVYSLILIVQIITAISSILLLYGVEMRKSQLLVQWLTVHGGISLVFYPIFLICCSFLIALPILELCLFVVNLIWNVYTWLIVYSLYKEYVNEEDDCVSLATNENKY